MSEPAAASPIPDAAGSICPEDGAARVLIVDDEEPVLEILTYVVIDAGYEPLTAPHGRRALEIARSQWPALLITDLMMPYLSGADLIATLREEAAMRGLSPIPVILITGAGLSAARAAGADVVLAKPFELSDLDRLIQRFLGPQSTQPGVTGTTPG